jgi:hypothetical protein
MHHAELERGCRVEEKPVETIVSIPVFNDKIAQGISTELK